MLARTSILLILPFILCTLFAEQARAQNEIIGASAEATFSDEQEFLAVEQAFQVLPSAEDTSLSLLWTIHSGYYLYQHQFKIQARNANTVENLDLTFEKGKFKYDEFFDKELTVYYHNTQVTAPLPGISPPYELKISSQGCADAGLCYPPRNQYFEVDKDGLVTEFPSSQFITAAFTASNSNLKVQSPPNTSTNEKDPFLPFILLGAILGGLILNLMPCVFPVLSLKALSFASSHLNPHKQHLHGWAYTAGVMGSFLVAAFAIMLARQAGELLGWGFQLQQPGFVAFMVYLFFVMGLSLSGLFHVGTQWMGAGQSLTTGQGLSSSFFTGVLAALVASPCTAPFMATALGFALTQPMIVSLSIFAALGFGMALPFLLLSYSPALAKFLPAPGAWMDTLKQALAFPLYITCVWLLWVVARQATSDGAIAVLLGTVLIAFGIWIMQLPTPRLPSKLTNKGLGLASLLCAAYIGYSVGDFSKPNSDMWEKYSAERLDELRSAGTPVFVDLTADWCITCKFNERVALNTDAVRRFVILNDIVLLQGDWTNADPEISKLLEKYGRSGVPLYIMYPSQTNTEGTVLPQILTENMVLQAMARALL
ncbi:MAG: thiol:disulfide interchange protein [Lentisphaeria bacterium]|jgi:thiol:disulfide interchange protein